MMQEIFGIAWPIAGGLLFSIGWLIGWTAGGYRRPYRHDASQLGRVLLRQRERRAMRGERQRADASARLERREGVAQ